MFGSRNDKRPIWIGWDKARVESPEQFEEKTSEPDVRTEVYLPVVFDESNIDLTSIENQIQYWQRKIDENKMIKAHVESLEETVNKVLSKYPTYMELFHELNMLAAENMIEREKYEENLKQEMLRMKQEGAAGKEILDKLRALNESQTISANEKPKLSDKQIQKLYKSLKKELNRVLHPDKLGSDFSKAMYDHAKTLLEAHAFDELRTLLDELKTTKNKKASKFSKKAAAEKLKRRVEELKAQALQIQEEVKSVLLSPRGILCVAYEQFGDSYDLMRTAINLISEQIRLAKAEKFRFKQTEFD